MQDPEHALAEASDFLVNQMKLIQEESTDLTSDNQELRRNYDELCSEVSKLNSQKQYFESCFVPDNYADDSVFKAVQSIKTRIEELYDLGEDLKTYSTKQEVSDLGELSAFVGDRLKRLRDSTVVRLSAKIESIGKTCNTQDKEEHTVEFFAKLLSEKDLKLDKLSAEYEKEQKESRDMQTEIEMLRGKVEGLDIMCFGKHG